MNRVFFKGISLGFGLCWVQPSPAQLPGDVLFSQEIVHSINIDFYLGNYWDSLTYYKEQGDITGENKYIPAIVTFDGVVLDSVGIRLRGNSSYDHPGTKKPLKLDFNQYISGQKFDGLKSVVLNNSSYDPTMVREKLFLDLLNRHGVTSPRCVYTRVSFNETYVGLYKLLEPIDKTFIDSHFSFDNGNLYKGEPNAPLTWEGNIQSAYYDNFELNTNETQNDWTGLIDFIYGVNQTGAAFANHMETGFDVHTYIKAWAANNLFANLDCYMYLPHNYYLYDDSPSGKFRWITWDVGLVLGILPQWFTKSHDLDVLYLPDPPEGLPLNNSLLKDELYRNEYLNAVCDYFTSEMMNNNLILKIDSLADMIRPHVYDEPAENRMYTTQDFESNMESGQVQSFLFSSIPGLKTFLYKRREAIFGQLCDMKWSCATGSSYANMGDQVIQVYPNPASGNVTIKYVVPYVSNTIQYEMFDVSGRRVESFSGSFDGGDQTKTMSTSHLAPGVYYIRSSSECEAPDKKLVIIK